MARVMNMSKLQAAEMFPKHLDLIDTSIQYGNDATLYTVESYREEAVGRRGYWYMNEGRDEIRIIDHHEKIATSQYVIIDELQNKVFVEPKYTKAKEFFAGLVDGYTEAGESIIADNGEQLVYMNHVNVDKIIQTTIIGDQVAEQKILNLPTFPYKILFSYFNNGDYFSVVDNMRDVQYFANRLISQWDYSVGTSVKNAYTVKIPLLQHGYSLEKLRGELSKTGAVIPVVNHDALHPVVQPPIKPELFQGVDFAINTIKFISICIKNIQKNQSFTNKIFIYASSPYLSKRNPAKKQFTHRHGKRSEKTNISD
jgi:hypothetical protein